MDEQKRAGETAADEQQVEDLEMQEKDAEQVKGGAVDAFRRGAAVDAFEIKDVSVENPTTGAR
jgi:hypothetical protein